MARIILTEEPAGRKRIVTTPQMWQLLQLCAAEPRAWDFIRDSIESDARRIANEAHAHGCSIMWQPSWLPRISREILRALKPSK